MKLPHVNAGSAIYLQCTDHFEGAAEAWADAEIITVPQTKAVSEALALVSAAANGLRGSVTNHDDAARTATKLRARYRVRDVILDLRVMGAGDAVLNGLCDRKHGHPTYRFVFAGGTAGDLTNAKIREEPEQAQQALDRYNKVDDFPGKQVAGDSLSHSIKRSLDTRDQLDAAEKAENTAGDDELLARLAVRTALQQAYGILTTAFPGKRNFVESFFLKLNSRDAAPAEEPEQPTPPANG